MGGGPLLKAMNQTELQDQKVWKKVYENDLRYIIAELKEVISVPACIILTGEVGAGKTKFTQVFAEIISEGDILSPTYSIISETRKICHADFYRIKNSEEITHLELSLYLEDKEYFLVEWGKPYLRQLKREAFGFHFYEIEITINPTTTEQNPPTRNYFLRPLDLN